MSPSRITMLICALGLGACVDSAISGVLPPIEDATADGLADARPDDGADLDAETALDAETDPGGDGAAEVDGDAAPETDADSQIVGDLETADALDAEVTPEIEAEVAPETTPDGDSELTPEIQPDLLTETEAELDAVPDSEPDTEVDADIGPPGCETTAQCDDLDPCSVDSCEAGTCRHVRVPGCCLETTDCDDGNACTGDACLLLGPFGICQHTPLPAPGCCLNAAECPSVACQSVSCSSFQCLYSDTGNPECCTVDADCQNGSVCTLDTCKDGTCAHVPTGDPSCCKTTAWLVEDFSGEDPMVFDDGSPSRWQRLEGFSTSEPWALHFGDPETGSYDTGERTFGTAQLRTIEVPQGNAWPTLRFRVWLDIEAAPTRDDLNVRLLVGNSAFEVWNKSKLAPEQYGVWNDVSLALPQAVQGQEVRVQFNFDSIDAVNNGGQGVYLDDIELGNICP
ncbi:MAG: hypothetical protein R3F39_12955 [Myxococcota bacterium]